MKTSPRRFLPTVIVLALSIHIALAQQYPFVRYGTADGIAQNYITDIAQDHRGFLWVGTGDAGVSRFDGTEFVTFDKHSAAIPVNVTALATDGVGFLFVAGNDGVSCLRLPMNTADKDDSLLNQRLGSVPGPVREMYMRSPRELYIAGPEHAWMLDLTDNSLKMTPVLPPREARLQALHGDKHIRDMARDCEGRYWLATDRGLLLHDDAVSLLFDRSNGLPVDNVLSVFCDDEGNVWAGTVDGLFKLTLSRIENFLPGRELSPDALGVWSILATRENVLWIGTIGGGVTRLFGGETRTFRKKDGLPSDKVSSLLELPNGEIFLGTDEGLALISANRITRMDAMIALPDRRVEALHRSSDGNYWIATHGGLATWDGTKTRLFTTKHGLPSNRITSLAEDELGFLLVGTHAGAARINLRSGSVYNMEELNGVRVASVFIDSQGREWYGTVGAGVIYRGDGMPTRITRDDGLAGNTVYFIAEDMHGSMYFGTNTGISVLPAGNIDHMLNSGSVYVSGGVDPETVLPVLRSQSLHTLSTRSGLVGDEMNSGAVFRDGAGSLWFGAIGGVSRFHAGVPPSLGTWSFPECGVSRGVPRRQRLLLAEVRINDTLTTKRLALELGPSDRVLMIRLLAPSFRNPGEVRYLYKLDGLEYTWHRSDDGRILYTAIPPGEYRLMVHATLGEGHWTPVYQVLTINVMPPFTETIWFWLLMIVVAAVGGSALMYVRSRKQLEIERMRMRIASDLHDDIGASLGTISLLGDVERRRAGEGDGGNLEKISELARQSVQDMSDIVWSVNPAHDTIEGLLDYLRKTAEEFSRASGIDIEVTPVALRPEVHIDATKRRAIMLIAKEALHNAVRHSRCTRIVLRLERTRHGYDLHITDDGRGFDPAAVRQGEGLRNMRRRSEPMGWTLDLDTGAAGTAVQLHFFL